MGELARPWYDRPKGRNVEFSKCRRVERSKSRMTDELNFQIIGLSNFGLSVFRIHGLSKLVLIKVFQINQLTLNDHILDSDLYVITNSYSQRWKIAGTANPRKEQADIQLYNQYKETVRLPYLEDKYRLAVSFDSIRINIQEIDKSGSELAIKGSSSITNLNLNHPRISSQDVQVKNRFWDFGPLMGLRTLTLDFGSRHPISKLKNVPQIEYGFES